MENKIYEYQSSTGKHIEIFHDASNEERLVLNMIADGERTKVKLYPFEVKVVAPGMKSFIKKKSGAEVTHQMGGLYFNEEIGKELGIAVGKVKEKYDAKDKEKEAKLEEEMRQAKQWAIENCPEGFVVAQQNWSNGDLMSAEYETLDGVEVISSDLKTCHKGGWYWIEKESYLKAKAEADAKQAKINEKKAQSDQKKSLLIQLAKETGEKQKWDSYVSENCTTGEIDCSFDHITIWIDQDGQFTKSFQHCH